MMKTADAEKMMMQREIDNLRWLLDRVERERDAAIRDMGIIPVCAICIHKEEKDALAGKHDYPSQCMNCITERSQFVWRGPCKENGGIEA